MPGNRKVVDEIRILTLVSEALDDLIQHGFIYFPRGRSKEVEGVYDRCDLRGILLRKQASIMGAYLSANEVIRLNKVATRSERSGSK